MRRVMVNTWTTWSRRRWRGEKASPAVAEAPASGDVAAEVARRLALRDALKALTGRQRAVLVLRVYDDLPEAQVAADAELLGRHGQERDVASAGQIARRSAAGRVPGARGPVSEMDNRQWREFMDAAIGVPPGRVTVAAVRRRLVRRRIREAAGVLAVVVVAVVGVTAAVRVFGAAPGPAAPHRPAAPTVYVTYAREARDAAPQASPVTLIPISTATNRAGKPIQRRAAAISIAITPDGKTALRRSTPTLARSPRSAPPPTRPVSRSTSAAAVTGPELSRSPRTGRPPTSPDTGLRHGHPDQHRHQHARQADPASARPGLRSRSRRTGRPPTSSTRPTTRAVRHGDPDQHRHQHARQADPRRPRSRTRSRSPRTGRPPTSTAARSGHADQHRHQHSPASRSTSPAAPARAIAITPDGKTAYVITGARGRSPRSAPPPTRPGSRSKSRPTDHRHRVGGNRDHAGREDRLRRQSEGPAARSPRSAPPPTRPASRSAIGCLALAHRDHPGREDRLRRRPEQGRPDQHRHQHARQADPGPLRASRRARDHTLTFNGRGCRNHPWGVFFPI